MLKSYTIRAHHFELKTEYIDTLPILEDAIKRLIRYWPENISNEWHYSITNDLTNQIVVIAMHGKSPDLAIVTVLIPTIYTTVYRCKYVKKDGEFQTRIEFISNDCGVLPRQIDSESPILQEDR